MFPRVNGEKKRNKKSRENEQIAFLIHLRAKSAHRFGQGLRGCASKWNTN